MRQPLKAARLESARPPLARLTRRGWIWRGEQPLDGLLVERSGAWRGAFAPWLDRASALLESEGKAILLFAEPVAIDCGNLGRALPLRRVCGALCSFPIEPPTSAELRNWMAGRLLTVQGGEPTEHSLAAFAPGDLSAWLDLSAIEVARADSAPMRAQPRRRVSLVVEGEALSQREFAQAGFENIRAAIGRSTGDAERRGRGERGGWVGPLGHSAGRLGAAIAILAMLLLIATAFSGGGDLGGALTALLAPALFLAAAALALWFGFGSGGEKGRPRRRGAAKARATATGSAREASASQSGSGFPWAFVGAGVFLAAVLLIGMGKGLGAALAFALSGLAGLLAILALGALAGAAASVFGRPGDAGARARGGAPAQQPEPGGAPPSPRRAPQLPGWLRRLLQISPLTDRALGRYARRVEELERLFAEGRVEEALKKGLALDPRSEAEDAAPRADEPVFGPGVRQRLEVAATRTAPQRALAALPPEARARLQELYRAQAEACAAAAQVEQAAFIHAELLGDVEAAVKAFAEAGRLDVAARLAQGRELAPAIFIPLWYRAGEKRRALLLAERHGAYEVLLGSTAPEDAAFRGEIRRAWAQRLAGVGDYVRALAVSAAPEQGTGDTQQPEPDQKSDEGLQALRRRWMREGLAGDEPDSAVIARAVKALPLFEPGDEDEMEKQPDAAMQAVEALLAERGERAARRRKALAQLLLNPGLEPERDEAFSAQRLPWIADHLTRRLLEDEAEYGLMRSLQPLIALAEAGGQASLAVDLRSLPRTPPQTRTAARTLTLAPLRGEAALVCGAPLRAGRTLLAFEDGVLDCVDRSGRSLWRDRVWKVRDVVAIAPGRMALVLREEPGGLRLSIIDTERGRHAEIGPLAATAWAGQAGPEGWLIHEPGRVVNLRIDPLLAALEGPPPAALEPQWSTPIIVDGQIGALTHEAEPGDALWLLRRLDGELERWRVARSSLRVGYETLRFAAAYAPCVTSDLKTFEASDAARSHHRFLPRRLPAGAEPPKPSESQATPPTLEEIHLRRAMPGPRRRLAAPIGARIGSTGLGTLAEAGLDIVDAERRVMVRVAFPGAAQATFRDASFAEHLVAWDDQGRYIVLESERAEFVFANTALSG